ncbi:MAG: biopolymer transporter ExbD [Saprospiraceae bacterium]|jgi:biopolymer transport protein ExbD|nr:biopolymer transporter ExbD [Saprospiraceae bacterium]
MGHFKKKRGDSTPAISTASLPDIVFILLFFFMVITKMRETDLKVKVQVPQATELEKLEQKSLVHFIYIGRPMERYQNIYGTAPRIQLDDSFKTVEDIPLFVENHKQGVQPNLRPRIATSLRVDGDITMGIVQDVKVKLRKIGQLKLNYAARRRAEKAKE